MSMIKSPSSLSLSESSIIMGLGVEGAGLVLVRVELGGEMALIVGVLGEEIEVVVEMLVVVG